MNKGQRLIYHNVSDGQFHTLNEIISTICQTLCRKPPRLSLPVRPVRLSARVLEAGAEKKIAHG
jgi:hypothetical protein